VVEENKMNQGSGFLLVILGLLTLYIVITGKFAILENGFNQLFNINQTAKPAGGSQTMRNDPSTLPDVGVQAEVTLPQIFIPNYTGQ
jgi:hypothetical protein